MDRLRIGLVGYGFGGRYFHAPLISSAQECEFVGVVTTSAERRELVTAEHPDVSVFDSLEAIAAAGAEAVSISTPAGTHSTSRTRPSRWDCPSSVTSPSPSTPPPLVDRSSLPLRAE